jgi:hypothetical protein
MSPLVIKPMEVIEKIESVKGESKGAGTLGHSEKESQSYGLSKGSGPGISVVKVNTP